MARGQDSSLGSATARSGDDGLLSAVVTELEREGFRVIGADQLLASRPRRRRAARPDPPRCRKRWRISRTASRIARALGALDIGQAVVVQQGLVLGVEAIEGTDALIRRCAALRREGPGGVLVKVEKPGQEQRADRPTIGPQTVALAAEAGSARYRGRGRRDDRRSIATRSSTPPTAPVCSSSASRASDVGKTQRRAAVCLHRRRRALGRCAWRGADRGAATAHRRSARASPGSAASGCARRVLESLVPLADLAVIGRRRGAAAGAADLAAGPRDGRGDPARCGPMPSLRSTAPGFSWRVAQRLRRRGETLPLIHYVAPMVWAWRAGRARRMARWYDHLMALLPFEPPYFERVGLACSYVGHPVLDSGADRGDGARFRAAHGIAADELVITVLPGSRGGEVRRLLPIFGAASSASSKRMIGPFRVVVPTVATVAAAVARGRAQLAGQTDRAARSAGEIRRLCREPRRARRFRNGRARTGDGAAADGRRLSAQPADRGAARPRSSRCARSI